MGCQYPGDSSDNGVEFFQTAELQFAIRPDGESCGSVVGCAELICNGCCRRVVSPL